MRLGGGGPQNTLQSSPGIPEDNKWKKNAAAVWVTTTRRGLIPESSCDLMMDVGASL